MCTGNSGTLALRKCCAFSKEVFFLPESIPSRVQTSNALSATALSASALKSKPRRPRAAIPSVVKLSESVYINVFYIDGHPVLSVVCAGTRYTAAGCMVRKSTADLWDTLQRICILPLAVCPLNIRLDSASEHRSDEKSGLASGCGIE
jgi:hypothetical protein